MAVEIADALPMTNGITLGEDSEGRSGTFLRLLIQRAKQGDSEAFGELITLHQQRVASTAWRMLGSREDARDATQEAFLRAYKYLGRFDESQSFAAWLYKIVINVCRDISRKRGAPGRVTSFEEERDLGNLEYLASGDDVEASAIVSQQQRLVALALETLPAKERAAIVLRDLEGLSTREVARILGSSQATVRAQICSARLKIRQFHEKVLRRKGTQ